MEQYAAIMRVTDDSRVAVYQMFSTEAEAIAHIERCNAPPPPPEPVEGEDPVEPEPHVPPYPDAFVVQDIGGSITDWRVVGQTVEFDAIPEPVPTEVSARQFKLQLLEPILPDHPDGIEALVTAFIAASARPVQIAYENSAKFVRNEPMLVAGFAALGFTTPQIDAFYIAANKK